MGKITLGEKVRDKVTGFTGIATSRVEYLNKCVRYCVTPKAKVNATDITEGAYVDEEQLVVVGKGVTVKAKPTGGSRSNVPRKPF